MSVVGPPTSGRPKVARPERRKPRISVDAGGAEMRRGVVRVPVRCPRRERTGAAATITLYAVVQGRKVRLRSKTVDLGSGQRRSVAFRLGRRDRLIVRGAGRRNLVAQVKVVDHKGTTGRQAKKLSL